jgi:hypothetical protein
MENATPLPTTLSTGNLSRSRALTPEQLLVLLLAIGQVVSPALITALTGRSVGDSSGPEPLTTPAGYTFIIWAPITLGSLAFAVYQALPTQSNRGFYPAIRRPAMLVFAGFTLWILAAVNDWLWVTVAIFVAMFFLLWRILLPILAEKTVWTTAERWVVALPFSLYTGWATVAIFANTAAALTFSGWPVTGMFGLTWQVAILIAATVNAVIGLRRTGGDLPYLGVILWALGGIVVRNLNAAPSETPLLPSALPAERILVGVCATAAAVVVGVTVFLRRFR